MTSVTSEVASFLVCGTSVFFGFATESVVRFLGMTDVYLNTSNNSQSCIAIRVLQILVPPVLEAACLAGS